MLNEINRLRMIKINDSRAFSSLSVPLNQNLKHRGDSQQKQHEQRVPPIKPEQKEHLAQPEQERLNYWRWISEEGPPDANELQGKFSDSDRASNKKDYEYIKSQHDMANYPAPKRLSSLKETVHADLKQAQQSYKAAQEAVKESVGELPKKAKELEEKIESKGAKLAKKVKRWVKGD